MRDKSVYRHGEGPKRQGLLRTRGSGGDPGRHLFLCARPRRHARAVLAFIVYLFLAHNFISKARSSWSIENRPADRSVTVAPLDVMPPCPFANLPATYPSLPPPVAFTNARRAFPGAGRLEGTGLVRLSPDHQKAHGPRRGQGQPREWHVQIPRGSCQRCPLDMG